MREWIVVPLTGGLSGLITSLIALWLRLEREAVTKDKRLRSARYWLASMLINAVGGGFVSFFLWATYTDANFSTNAAPTGVVGASIAVGVFGVGAVQRFLFVENNLDESLNETAKSNADLQEASESLKAVASIDQSAAAVHTARGGSVHDSTGS